MGGATGPGQSGDNQPGASTQSQAQPGALAGRSLLWTWWQVPSCWQGDKEVSCRVTAPLAPSIGPGNNPGGDEVNRALSAPRAGTGMEMGCSSPTSLQAACGAHGHDWCDAVVSSVAPRSPLPITIPTAGGRRGLVVEPQLVCSNSSITACVQMRWGHPQRQGAEGIPGPGECWERLCCPDSAALPAESAGAASRWAHVLGWAPTPPWPRSQLRGHRAGGDIPNNPKTGSSLKTRDLQRC